MCKMFVRTLSKLFLFQDLNPSQLELVKDLVKPIKLSKDAVVFEQGEEAQYIYLVTDGRVAVHYKPYDGPILTVSHVAPGGVFGWSAALGRAIYTSSAVCETDCEIYRIHGRDLQVVCVEHPEIGRPILERMAGVIAEGLRDTHVKVLDLLSQGLASVQKDFKQPGFLKKGESIW